MVAGPVLEAAAVFKVPRREWTDATEDDPPGIPRSCLMSLSGRENRFLLTPLTLFFVALSTLLAGPGRDGGAAAEISMDKSSGTGSSSTFNSTGPEVPEIVGVSE